VTIYSRDAAAAHEATRLGTAFLQQPPDRHGLNDAIAYAQQQHQNDGAILIVPADLPLITAAEIDELVAAASDEPRVVAIAPATDGGTNGLLLRPPTIIGPAYGPDSAKRHEEAARRSDARVITLRSPHWLLDLDTPEQIGELRLLAAARSDAAELHTLRCLRDADFAAITDE
jgi:2-phospho-L-lactate guanylyltransferase